MSMRFFTVFVLSLSAPALAQESTAPADPAGEAAVIDVAAMAGDAAKGEADFKKCKACHSIVGADGTAIQKGGTTGPNLYGVFGHPVASQPDFKYGDGILAAKAAGAVWDEENMVAYLQDPNAWVKAASGDDGAKSKMTFKLTKGAEDMAAYLATLSAEAPAAEPAAGAAEEPAAAP